MIWKSKQAKNAALDQVITELEQKMSTTSGDTDEYATMLNRLERLHKLKEREVPKQISPDTLLVVGGNLLGILIIVSYEHGRVITSKAMSFAGKLR